MKKIIFITVLVSLTGCQSKLEKVEACWAAETKTAVESLARKMALQSAVELVKGALKPGEEMNQERKAFIDKSFTVSTSDFFVKSADPATGNLRCGANVKVGFTNRHGVKRETDERIFEFDISKGENGPYFVTNQLVFSQMVIDLDGKLREEQN